jgi:decaprenyl-phosphate phosphoribosyltransferase
VLAALLRYLLVLENGGGAAPEEVFARDRVLQVMGAAWLVLFGLGVYLR